jgi:hypothetical protein
MTLSHASVPGRTWRTVLGAAVLLGAVVGVPAAAHADLEGPCTATLAGVDAATAGTPGDAITVGSDDIVLATGTMSSGPVDYAVQLEFAGIRWTVADGTATGDTWSDEIDISSYATYGVGLYKVHATSANAAGESCTLDAYVEVDGSPFTTVAGLAGLVAAVAGVAVTVLSVLGLHRRVTRARVSVGGAIGGFLFGLGALVVLQQAAVVFPTLIVTLVMIVGGLVIGAVVLPLVVPAAGGPSVRPPAPAAPSTPVG